MTNPILIESHRGGYLESYSTGSIVIALPNGKILSVGDSESLVFPRSSLKLVQSLAVLESGAADAFSFSDKELTVITASHRGQPIHTAAVTGILDKLGLGPEYLRCGVHSPTYRPAADELIRSNEPATVLHNNCSGKHSGILALCLHKGFSLERYEDPTHPAMIYVADLMADVLGMDASELTFGVDGCSLPAFRCSLRALASAMQNYSSLDEFTPSRRAAVVRLLAALKGYPRYLGGDGSFATKIIQVSGGQVIAKNGADGVFAATMPQLGVGIALKIDDGRNASADAAMASVMASIVGAHDMDLAIDGDLPKWLQGDGSVFSSIRSVRGDDVGEIKSSPGLQEFLRGALEQIAPA